MEVRANIKSLRFAPRKVRAIANLIKKRTVNSALDQLEHMTRRPVLPLIKLIKSAVANAENTYHMVRDNLYIKNLIVDEGIKLKRYFPRALGRATEIQRKTCHVRITLDEKVPGLKRSAKEAKKEVGTAEQAAKITTEPRQDIKPEIKRESGKKSGGIIRKFFQRKAV